MGRRSSALALQVLGILALLGGFACDFAGQGAVAGGGGQDPAGRADAGPDGASAPRVQTVTVMSVNLRHHADDWERRFPLIADEIVRLDPDVIGLQEVQVSIGQLAVLQDLIADRGGAAYDGYAHRKTGLGYFTGEGIGILSREPMMATDLVDLGEGRLALRARVELADGAELDVYNTHLHHRGGDEVRLGQARIITEWIAEHDDGAPYVLAGDLNATPDSGTLVHFRESGLVDSYRAIHGADAEVSGKTSPIRLEEGAFEQEPRRRIDYVLASEALDPAESLVGLRNHDDAGFYPSDHLGVMTLFELR